MSWFDRYASRQHQHALLENGDRQRRIEFPTLQSWVDSIPPCDDRPTVDQCVEHLDVELGVMIALLRSIGEQYWWQWLDVARRRLRDHPAAGARYFLRAFDGAHGFLFLPVLSPLGSARSMETSDTRYQIYALQQSAYRHADLIVRHDRPAGSTS